ncbi:ATP-binding protein [Caldanaerobius polysaccharolyticus]|uniref:ATP-binding protein n=1 Tax=Caldanaerobius polysaccharolyticus TaxID=44256 RepID=UPI0006912648
MLRNGDGIYYVGSDSVKIPYGISNFKRLREEGYLYVDKTMFIEKIEKLNSNYLFFIRPRRFGKSLFLSTLENYYDINAVDDFNELFGDLYIGKNPTNQKNKYMIFRLNFSGLNTSNKDSLEESFKLRLLNSAEDFFNKYKNIFGEIDGVIDRIKNIGDISSIFITVVNQVKNVDGRIYLIIDEYDHFANDIIAMGESQLYKEIIRASGFVRDFYETVKIGTESVVERIFITGISPIMLDDLTSGFNIALNITMDVNMNEMLGFTESEVNGIIEKLGIERKDIMINLREYYNGYLFNEFSTERVYNPDMVLYFLDQFIRFNQRPRYLIDDNVKMDYGRLNRLSMNIENQRILKNIVENEGITSDVVTRFSFDRMYDQEYFVSLLFYMGLLTIDRKEKSRLILKIPNYVIKTVYWEYVVNSIKREYNIVLDTESLRIAIEEMAYNGDIMPYIDYIRDNVLKALSNRDMIDFNEKYIKVILFSYLVLSGLYRPVSEREVENRYIDICFERDIRATDVKYEWLIELKYVKEKDRSRLEAIKQEGLRQLAKYVDSKGFKERKDVKAALVVFIGKGEYMYFENPL